MSKKLCFFTSLLLCAHAQSVRTYIPEIPEFGSARGIPAMYQMWGTTLPRWSGKALIGVQDNQSNGPLIYMIDKDGRRDEFSFTIPEAGTLYIHGLAMDSDGTVAIVGGASSIDSRVGSFLALVSPDRKSQRVVRTWPYVAWEVVFVPDGSVWTVGYTFHDVDDRVVKPNIMSHFDHSGKLIKEFVVAAKSRAGNGRSAADNSFLRASSDRIGWFTNGMEYIEFSFDGRELARFDGPVVGDVMSAARQARFALSDDNEVLFSTTVNEKGETWALERNNRAWILVQFDDKTLPSRSALLGFDGHTLVTTGQMHQLRRYKFKGSTQ